MVPYQVLTTHTDQKDGSSGEKVSAMAARQLQTQTTIRQRRRYHRLVKATAYYFYLHFYNYIVTPPSQNTLTISYIYQPTMSQPAMSKSRKQAEAAVGDSNPSNPKNRESLPPLLLPFLQVKETGKSNQLI
jgi:lysozyme family protein